VKWYEKTWEWIKKYWGIVLSAVTLAIGYFTVGATFKYKQLSLTAEHQCIHPVISSQTHDQLKGGYNRIEITIRSK